MRLIGKIYAGAFVLVGLIGLSGVTYADNFEIKFGSVKRCLCRPGTRRNVPDGRPWNRQRLYRDDESGFEAFLGS